jgi:hypothetical protein
MQFSTEYRDTLTDQIQRATVKLVEHINQCDIPAESDDMDDMEWRSSIIGLDLADTISASLCEFGNPILKGMVMKELMCVWIQEQFVLPEDEKAALLKIVFDLTVPNGE